jgi:hypothetical protein
LIVSLSTKTKKDPRTKNGKTNPINGTKIEGRKEADIFTINKCIKYFL